MAHLRSIYLIRTLAGLRGERAITSITVAATVASAYVPSVRQTERICALAVERGGGARRVQLAACVYLVAEIDDARKWSAIQCIGHPDKPPSAGCLRTVHRLESLRLAGRLR